MKISPMPRSRTSSSRIASTCDLHRDVERRGRLVGDQQVRLGDQHHGDHDALAHAARDLVRIEREDALGIADLHGFQHRERRAPGVARGCCRDAVRQRLGDLLADGHHRVRARISGPAGPSTMRAPRSLRSRVRTGRAGRCRRRRMRSAVDAGPGGGQAEDGAAGHRLARAGFADDAEPLAAEREATRRAPRRTSPSCVGKGDAEVVDVEQRARS